MRYFIVFFICILSVQLQGQNDTIVTKLQGVVYHSETRLPVENVHVINTTKVNGTTTDGNGGFIINAKVNDTLLFSYLGFETIKIKVSNDWIKNKTSKIYITEKAYALEEVVVSQYNLTGYIKVDTELIYVNENNFRYSISGLNAGYEGGDKSPNAVSRALGAIFNPADFLYSAFGKRPREMKKLKEVPTNTKTTVDSEALDMKVSKKSNVKVKSNRSKVKDKKNAEKVFKNVPRK